MGKPKTLYKYRSLQPDLASSYVNSILRESRIYLSYPSEFNDPFECQAEVLVDKDDPLVAGLGRVELLDTVRANLRGRILVYSMSAVNNNTLMWSHYADSHRGVCLGFDADSQDDIFSLAEPVVYQDGLPVMDLRADQYPIQCAKTVALAKGSRWAYEEEWRLVHLGSDRRIEFLPKSLTQVILGCEISKRHRLAVIAALATRQTPVLLSQAHRNALRHSVEIIPHGRISVACLHDENFIDASALQGKTRSDEAT